MRRDTVSDEIVETTPRGIELSHRVTPRVWFGGMVERLTSLTDDPLQLRPTSYHLAFRHLLRGVRASRSDRANPNGRYASRNGDRRGRPPPDCSLRRSLLPVLPPVGVTGMDIEGRLVTVSLPGDTRLGGSVDELAMDLVELLFGFVQLDLE